MTRFDIPVSIAVLLSLCCVDPGALEAEETRSLFEIPVVVVKYFPLRGDSIDVRVTGDWGRSLAFTRVKTDSLTKGLIDSLREGSRFRQYKDPGVLPSLRYRVVRTFEFLEPLPTYSKPGIARPMTDYRAITGRIDARHLVDSEGVKEIWLWGYDGGRVGLWESNMAGPFGDISNSDRDSTDLPVFGRTYTFYHYNYQRGLSEAVEDHMHQIEALLNFVDGRDGTPEGEWGSLLFWGKFVGYFPGGNWGSAAPDIPKDRRCGWAHYAPNSERDYDWSNRNFVLSDIEDWKPDGIGEQKRMNCEQWGCKSLKWFMYWMRSLPGRSNGLTYGGKPLTNWWVFVGDFDTAMRGRIRLVGE